MPNHLKIWRRTQQKWIGSRKLIKKKQINWKVICKRNWKCSVSLSTRTTTTTPSKSDNNFQNSVKNPTSSSTLMKFTKPLSLSHKSLTMTLLKIWSDNYKKHKLYLLRLLKMKWAKNNLLRKLFMFRLSSRKDIRING